MQEANMNRTLSLLVPLFLLLSPNVAGCSDDAASGGGAGGSGAGSSTNIYENCQERKLDYCEKESTNGRTLCYGDLAEDRGDICLCPMVDEGAARDICPGAVAESSGNTAYCSAAISPDNCRKEVALRTGDESICDQVEGPVLNEGCRQPFRDAEALGSECTVPAQEAGESDLLYAGRLWNIAAASARACVCDAFGTEGGASKSICLERVTDQTKNPAECMKAGDAFVNLCLERIAISHE